ncbi:hypothetical protein OsJ_20567 [Oryza sativa Japonica Group]|uniref:Fucosyltransferase n=1 Tax=Oryza sativa subsp. japonica TaxID=39947 RepID=B9FS59_ORYSJ|nr:hypothetical protein OsJ_20567 [Oryza sativa Japonica Group]
MATRGKKLGGVAGGGGAAVRVVGVVCVMAVPLFALLVLGGWASASTVWQSAARLTAVTAGFTNASKPSATGDAATGADELFDGLLAAGGCFDRGACLSRHESPRYYKSSPFSPSPYLLQKLRDYEARHRSSEVMECNYLVGLPYNGLGNRMLSLVASFLYALLTDRVFLVHFPDDFADHFCEPFPGGEGETATTWVLPPDFPVADLWRLGVHSNQSYGNLLAAKKITGDPGEGDAGVRAASDLYFVPSLYAIPEFQDELRWMFPEKESVTHLLARYLLHPSNSVWGMVMRYHHAYLAPAAEMIGVQIRMFSWASIPVDDMYKQVMACSSQERILPDTDGGDAPAPARTNTSGGGATTAILVASLQVEYYERLKGKYYEHAATASGGGRRWVGVFQPSHEEKQEMGKRAHNQKALAEIYLLSFADVLLTSGMSTFGYMSSALAGLRPAMLLTAFNHKGSMDMALTHGGFGTVWFSGLIMMYGVRPPRPAPT